MYGNLVQLLVTMKGLPLAYNKDLQEDKEGALDTAHTLMQCLSVMAGMISTWTVNEDAMRASVVWATWQPLMLPITWQSAACRSARHMPCGSSCPNV